MGVKATAQRPKISRRQLFRARYGLAGQPAPRLQRRHPALGPVLGRRAARRRLQVSHDGRRATLEAENVCVLDSFQFGGPTNVPASVSFKVRWEATGRPERRGRGGEVPPTDPAAFLGRFAAARSTGSFSGFEVGFSFKGRGATDRGYAQLGPERNGTFLS